MIRLSTASAFILCIWWYNYFVFGQGEDDKAKLRFQITDTQHAPLPCRIHLKNERDRSPRITGYPFWHDHFVCSGRATLELQPGLYRYEIQRGPEYEPKRGRIEIVNGRENRIEATLRRTAHLREQGWYCGDLHVHRSMGDIELLMRAEDLDFAPVITWWNDRNPWQGNDIPVQQTRTFDSGRIYNVMAGEDEREGGALLFFGLNKPLDLLGSGREFPSPMRFVNQAREDHEHVWIDIEKPFWWDVPTWLASRQMNSIGIANNHMCRSRMYEDEAWGRPRDKRRLPNPRGNGYWTQEIYYHILNCGLRIPPSAGSASGVLPNPVGYNRVYVYLDEPFTRDAWFRGLGRGRSFVTNGPILLVRANGQHPGYSFESSDDLVRLTLEIELVSNDRVPRIEIVHNGEVIRTVDCSAEVSQRRRLTLDLERSGWFLVRAITDVKSTFRFASTAPWYVDIPDQRNRQEQESARFFVKWVDERIERVRSNISDDEQRNEVLRWHQRAREFWAQKVASSDH